MNETADRTESVFAAAVEFASPEERAAFLEQACAGDPALRERIDALLRAHDRAGHFIDLPAAKPGAPEQTGGYEPSGEQPGIVLAGRYKLLEQIGEGGMGTVWVAEQTQPVRRKVAVKLIKAGMDSKTVLSRFEAERQALALMDHPNIAKVLDGGTTGEPGGVSPGRPFFVMEYVKGVPFNKYCDDARLSIAERLALFLPVCQAVQHAHQKGIIHRDLKPSNILVCLYDGKPVPKVIDFGLAKAMHQSLTEHTLYTAHGVMMGTPLYMSPEQAELNNLDVDTRTDIYALGVILYELLTGTTPLEKQRFQEAAWLEMLRLIKEEEPPLPSARLSGSGTLPSVAAQRHMEPAKLTRVVRGELDWIVMKCLEKDRSRRYETANGLARDVERYLSDEVVEARPPSAGYRLRKLFRRHKGPVLAASLVFLTLVGGIIGTTWQAVRAIGAEQEAEQETSRALNAEGLAERRLREVTEERNLVRNAESQTRAVKEFLVKDMLNAAEPFRSVGGGLSIEQILDNAARKTDSAFPDQPEVEAELHQILARVYANLGSVAKAETHARRHLEIDRRLRGLDHPKTIEAALSFAEAVFDSGRHQEGLNLLRQALANAERVCGPHDRVTLDAAFRLGGCLGEVNEELKEGERYLRQALKGFRELGAHPLGLESVLHELARNLDSQEKGKEAEPLFREALALATERGANDDVFFLMTQGCLGRCLSNLGKLPEAEALLRKALEGFQRISHKPHIMTYSFRDALAVTLRRESKFAEALPLQRQALEAFREHYGPENIETMKIQGHLALLFKDQKMYAEAVPLLRAVLAVYRREFGPRHHSTLQVLGFLVDTLLDDKKYEESMPLAQELAEARRQTTGEDDDSTLSAMDSLGFAFIQTQRWKDAETVLTQLLPLARRRYGDDDERTVLAMRKLGQVETTLGNDKAAEPLLQEILRVWRRSPSKGSEHEDTLLVQFDLGVSLRNLGRYEAAAELLSDCLAKNRRLHGEEDHSARGTLSSLAMTRVLQGELSIAENLLVDLARLQRKVQGSDHPDLAEALALLGNVHLRQMKFDEAESPLTEALAIREKKLPDAWTTFNTKSMLGGALLGQMKYADAEARLLAGYEGMKKREDKIPKEGKIRLTEALERLVQLYDAWDKKDDAAKWRKELEAHKEAEKNPKQ